MSKYSPSAWVCTQGRLRQVSLHGREWMMHLKALNLKVRGYNQRHKNGDETGEFFNCAETLEEFLVDTGHFVEWINTKKKRIILERYLYKILMFFKPIHFLPGQRCLRSPSWSYQTSPRPGRTSIFQSIGR